jgi:hypothetical protein
MSRQIVGKGLRFSLRHAPCAHICRYCLISESRKRSVLPFARFEQLVHRFYDWKQANGRDDFTIGIFVGPSFDYDLETLKGVARLHARRGSKFGTLNLGGLRRRDGTSPIRLDVRKVLAVDTRCALIRAALGIGMRQNVVAADLVVQGVEAIAGFRLRFRV